VRKATGLVDRRLGQVSGRRVPVDRAEEVKRLYRERSAFTPIPGVDLDEILKRLSRKIFTQFHRRRHGGSLHAALNQLPRDSGISLRGSQEGLWYWASSP